MTEQPDASTPTMAPSYAKQLYRIGKDQKMLQWLCLATLIVNLLAQFGIYIFTLGGPLQAVPGIVFIVGVFFYVRLSLAVRCISALLLGGALFLSMIVSFIPSFAPLTQTVAFVFFWGLLIFATLIAFAVMLRRATSILRDAGLQVGIMGAKTRQLKALLETGVQTSEGQQAR